MELIPERTIKEIMQATGLLRIDAEFIYALEVGNVEGDMIALDPENPPSDADEEDDDENG